jgi:hypothetical protein
LPACFKRAENAKGRGHWLIAKWNRPHWASITYSTHNKTAEETMPDKDINREPDRPPLQQEDRADPMLQITREQVTAAGVTLASVVAALVLAVVLYEVKGPVQHISDPPPSAHHTKPPTTGN